MNSSSDDASTTTTTTTMIARMFNDDSNDDDSLYSTFQNRFLSFVGPVAAVPSWVGSGLIIYVILSERSTLLKDTYHRLILGLSVMDFCLSLSVTAFAGSWYIPASAAEFVVGARADTFVLCTVQGMLENLYFGSLFYTVCLMLYYDCLLVLQWTKAFIARRLEPVMHAVSILATLLVMIGPASLHWMNPFARLPGTCLMQPYPVDCEFSETNQECTRGQDFTSNIRVFATVLVVSAFAIMLVTMISLVVTVCRTERKMRQYGQPNHPDSQSSSDGRQSFTRSSTTATTTTSSLAGLRHTRATIIRGLWYVGTYFLITISVVAYGLPDHPHTRDKRRLYFGVALTNAVVANNQGTFNALIYLRPRFRELTAPSGTLWFLRPLLPFLACCCCCCCNNSSGDRSSSPRRYNHNDNNNDGGFVGAPTTTITSAPPSASLLRTSTTNTGVVVVVDPLDHHNNNKEEEPEQPKSTTSNDDDDMTGGAADVFSNEYDDTDLEMNNNRNNTTRGIPLPPPPLSHVTAIITSRRLPSNPRAPAASLRPPPVEPEPLPPPLPSFVAKNVPVPAGYKRHVVVAPAARRLGLILQDDIVEDHTHNNNNEKVATTSDNHDEEQQQHEHEQEEDDVVYQRVVVVEEVCDDSCMSDAIIQGDRILSMDDMDVRHLTAKEVSDWIARYGMKMRRFIIERPDEQQQQQQAYANRNNNNNV